MNVRRLRHYLRVGLAAFLGAQAAAVIGVSAVDSYRKRGRELTGYPHLAPQTTELDDGDLTVYTYGHDLYDAMLEAISGAQHHIYFETYIWKNDPVGRAFKRALTAAAKRGVGVYVVFDEFANLVVRRSFFQFDDQIKVVRHPLVNGVQFLNPRNSGRNHRKLMVVDGEVAFVGGYNIGSLYASQWRDTHARVTGSAVADLENAFVDYWNLRPRRHRQLDGPASREWLTSVRVLRNIPRFFVYPIRNMYLEAIDRASERIWLTHAYLIPDDDLMNALIGAVTRGVDVRIIVPAESNHVVADWLSRGYYDRLLDGGVRMFLYQNAMVHAKTATIDGMWSTIGTANIDRLSLLGNYEVNLEITDASVAEVMERVFTFDLANCLEVNKDEWGSRSIVAKTTEAILSPLRPMF